VCAALAPALPRPHFTALPIHYRQQEAYVFIGDLGHACVLAFQDKPTESNDRFLALYRMNAQFLRLGGFGVPGPELLRQPEFLRQVHRALDYNYRNYQAQAKTFPPELHKLRQPDGKPRPMKP
jgi:hypothetical protein